MVQSFEMNIFKVTHTQNVSLTSWMRLNDSYEQKTCCSVAKLFAASNGSLSTRSLLSYTKHNYLSVHAHTDTDTHVHKHSERALSHREQRVWKVLQFHRWNRLDVGHCSLIFVFFFFCAFYLLLSTFLFSSASLPWHFNQTMTLIDLTIDTTFTINYRYSNLENTPLSLSLCWCVWSFVYLLYIITFFLFFFFVESKK